MTKQQRKLATEKRLQDPDRLDYLENADWFIFLSECDCFANGEEALDRREPRKYINPLRKVKV